MAAISVFLNSAHESQVLQDAASEVNAPSNDYWIGLANVGDDTWNMAGWNRVALCKLEG